MAKDYTFWIERLTATEKELEEARFPLTWLEHLPDSPAGMAEAKKLMPQEWRNVRNRWVNKARARAFVLREVEKLERRLAYIKEQAEKNRPESVWLRLFDPVV